MTATLEQARAAHLAHDLDTAATAYRALLPPDAVEALHGLGLLHLERDDPPAALGMIEAAHRLAPEGRTAHNLAVVLKRLGRATMPLPASAKPWRSSRTMCPPGSAWQACWRRPAPAARPPPSWSPSPTGVALRRS